eukprot:g12259.t1
MAVGGGAAQSGDGEAERQLLEEELHDAECTLLGEVQQIERLAEENNTKVEELRGLKDDVRILQERNEYHVSMLQDEHASAQQELAHRLAVLREQATHLCLKHERYKHTARLNEAGGAEVESLLLKMEQRTKTHGEDVHATRQEMLHLRQELESTFRKTLKDLGGTYRRKAFKALGNPAKEGMRTNKLLREEMALQEVGVAALSERHVEESKRAGKFIGELRKLRHSKVGHQSSLADQQREAKANATCFADIQETKRRISEARQSLKRDLDKQGVPSYCLREIRDMVLQEREEAQLLEKLKHVSTGLPAAGGMTKKQAAEAAWQARVGRVTRGWAKDRADQACFARVGGQGRDRDSYDKSARAAQPTKGVVPEKGEAAMARFNGKRSASSPALDSVLSPSSRPTPAPVAIGTTRPFGALAGSASTGGLQFRTVPDENPWERKHRMERAIRRRDAGIRAKGLAVNSTRSPKVACQGM